MHTKIYAVTERMRKKVQDVNIGRALYVGLCTFHGGAWLSGAVTRGHIWK